MPACNAPHLSHLISLISPLSSHPSYLTSHIMCLLQAAPQPLPTAGTEGGCHSGQDLYCYINYAPAVLVTVTSLHTDTNMSPETAL